VDASAVAGVEQSRALLRETLAPFSDSLTTALDAERRAMDWTHTNAEGERWGYTPGFVHLGRKRIPYTCDLFGIGELRAVTNAWTLHRSTTERAHLRELLEERARAIRARRDGGGRKR
jgi:hypothetical protein